MLKRTGGYFTTRKPSTATDASAHLEREGYVVVKGALSVDEIQVLRDAINQVFEKYPPDNRSSVRTSSDDTMFRYEMFNRSAVCQTCLSHPAILDTIEPLLGNDCHVIANTAWRNPAGYQTADGFNWHIDGGPHIPLDEGVSWPDNIPHPVFAVGVHVFLQDCDIADGPTGVIPGSHLSGRFPPRDKVLDDDLDYDGQQVVPLIVKAGDIGFFVSDLWHRRMPTSDADQGRFFLQMHYARRDISQRVHDSGQTNQVSEDAIERADNPRERTLVGLHEPNFYDG